VCSSDLFHLHEDIIKFKQTFENDKNKSFQRDQLEQILYNEIARVSRETSEEIKPVKGSFQISLSSLENSASFLAFDLRVLAKDQSKQIIELLKEGDFLGYVDLLKSTAHAETAAAMEDTDIVLIPKDDFLALIQANRDVSSQMIKMLANNITEKEEQLLNLAYNSVRKRVADALILLSQKEDNKSFHVLREDLARIVGTAKESVIRMLTEFKNDGYIDITEGTIIILDLKKLSNLPS
jgi:CRP-like cAMP-binding protein